MTRGPGEEDTRQRYGMRMPRFRDLATLVAMGKCTNCGLALDPGWKFCIACGAAVGEPDDEAPLSTPEPIPSAIRPITESDDAALPRKRLDAALIFGIVMAVGGGVLIIIVAIALFSPRV